jgi:hypothetical protein
VQPITVSPMCNEHDLFVGDSWFRLDPNTLEVEDNLAKEEPPNSMKPTFQDGLVDSDNEADAIVDCNHEPLLGSEMSVLTYLGLCRLLVIQAFPTARALLSVSEEEMLPYRATVLQSLGDLLKALDDSVTSTKQKQEVCKMISFKLVSVFNLGDSLEGGESPIKEPPLIVARSLECVSACFWDGIGLQCSFTPHVNTLELSKIFHHLCGQQKQPAWTVREAAALGCANLATKCHSSFIRKHEAVSIFVDCVAQALKDRKFWKVRYVEMVWKRITAHRC